MMPSLRPPVLTSDAFYVTRIDARFPGNDLFIFLYNEFAWTMARYSQQLQNKSIGIRDVGRTILSLCTRL